MHDASPPVSVPRIATERLLLREPRMVDFDDYPANLADPLASEHLAGPVERRAAWHSFAAACGSWMLQGAGWWGIELRATGKLVGTVGAFFREGAPDLEIGWTVYRRFWGKGFATEAATAAIAYGLRAYSQTRAVALIAGANTASVRVSEKLGMRYDKDIDFYGKPIGRYVLEA